MRTSDIALLLGVSLLGVGSTVQARADNILIENQGSKWKLGTNAASPLPVAAKKGDVIEFKVTGPHGVVTLDKPVPPPGTPAPPAPVPDLTLVLACGEDAASKPNAVLREIECGAASKFNKLLTAPMKLEVTDKFAADVHFWCIVHKAGMWGTIKLAAAALPPPPPPPGPPPQQKK